MGKEVSPEVRAYRKTLGKKIKILRDLSGLTQAQLAEAIEYSEKYLSAVENGHKGMKMQKLKKCAEIFNVPPESLLSEKELTAEQLKMLRCLWISFDKKDNPHNPSLMAILSEAAVAAKK